MAENAGRIEYDFVADTTGVLKAEYVVDKSTTNMANDFKKVDKAAATTSTQMTKAAAGVKKGVQANLGQAGIQVQQFVGQLQGGQSAMVALAQQSADLGIVLGAPLIGVFVSLAAVLAGTLAPAVFDSKTSLEKMEKAIERVQAVMTVGADGIANYSEEMQTLSRISQDLAKAKIDAAIISQEKALKEGLKSMEESFRDFGSFYDDRAAKIAENTKLPIGAIHELDKAFRLQGAKVGADDIARFQAVIETMREGLPQANKKGREMFSTLTDLVSKLSVGAESLNKLNESTDDTTASISNANSETADMALSLIEQKIALEQGERAALSFRLQLDGLTEAQKQHILSLYDANKATEASIEASKDSSKALEAEIDAYIKIGEEALKAEEKKEAAAQRERDRLAERGTTVGLTEVQSIEMKYENDLNALVAAREQQLITNQEYDAREIELNRQKQEAIRGAQAETNQFMQNAFGNLDTQIAGTMTSVVLGAQDGEDALKSLAKTILTQVVGAIIQQGIASAVASATAATGQTAANAAILSTAAPAAAAVSLATSGANAVPAVSGIAAVTAAVAGIGSLAGGRQYGGPVSNGMYRVNETGVPEIYSHGGKDYLMNTKNANIKPLEQGGGSGWSVNVENYGPDKVYTTIDEVNRAVNVGIAREAGKAAKGQGQLLKGMQKGTKLQRNARN